MHYTHKKDYQRAKIEDPKVASGWLSLFQNYKAKHGILDDNIYNFDEAGFLMGIIFAGMVVTTSDHSKRPSLAQLGNCEWATVIQGINGVAGMNLISELL
jgi:hypothetical protein